MTMPRINQMRHTMIGNIVSEKNTSSKSINTESEFQIKNSGKIDLIQNHMDQKFNIGQTVGAIAVALALFSPQPAMAADLGNGK